MGGAGWVGELQLTKKPENTLRLRVLRSIKRISVDSMRGLSKRGKTYIKVMQGGNIWPELIFLPGHCAGDEGVFVNEKESGFPEMCSYVKCSR